MSDGGWRGRGARPQAEQGESWHAKLINKNTKALKVLLKQPSIVRRNNLTGKYHSNYYLFLSFYLNRNLFKLVVQPKPRLPRVEEQPPVVQEMINVLGTLRKRRTPSMRRRVDKAPADVTLWSYNSILVVHGLEGHSHRG